MKKIVLLCSAGMSTSMLMTKMREYAASIGYECSVDAYPVSEAAKQGADADIVLLGPQVRFQLESVKKEVNCPVQTIDTMAYGMMDGKAVLESVIEVIGK